MSTPDIGHLATGLDLNRPDDRASFRQRIAIHYEHMKVEALRDEAGLGSRATRYQCIMRLADLWLGSVLATGPARVR